MVRAPYLNPYVVCGFNASPLLITNGSPKFNSSATFINGQLVCLLPAGGFNLVVFNLNYFVSKI